MRSISCAAMLVFAPLCAAEPGPRPDYSWQQAGEGVYVHSPREALAGPVDGNAVVIVGDHAALVVDTHIDPAAARDLVDRIRSVTDRPVTHVVNTHWHDDHVNGNHTLRTAWPEAAIVAHEATLEALRSGWVQMTEQRRQSYEEVDLQELLEAAEELENSEPRRAVAYRVYAGYVSALRPELEKLELVYPDVTFEDRFDVQLGGRTVRLEWLGRGNTDGDIIAWLPDERLVVTGDLLTTPIPFAFDSPMTDWVQTLDRLAGLGASTIIPGHGPVQRGNRHVLLVRRLLEDTLAAVNEAHRSGVTFVELEETIDLAGYEKTFTAGDPERSWAWHNYFVLPGLKSAWVSLGFPAPETE